MRTLIAVLLAAVLSACVSAVELTALTIERDGVVIAAYRVEIAATPQERARGLMFREMLARDRGMIFDYPENTPQRFWMKNTPLSLDILFIDAQARITRIAADTVPFSTEPIASGGPVRAVLELNAGEAATRGIAPGDLVRHAIFGTAPAP